MGGRGVADVPFILSKIVALEMAYN